MTLQRHPPPNPPLQVAKPFIIVTRKAPLRHCESRSPPFVIASRGATKQSSTRPMKHPTVHIVTTRQSIFPRRIAPTHKTRFTVPNHMSQMTTPNQAPTLPFETYLAALRKTPLDQKTEHTDRTAPDPLPPRASDPATSHRHAGAGRHPRRLPSTTRRHPLRATPTTSLRVRHDQRRTPFWPSVSQKLISLSVV